MYGPNTVSEYFDRLHVLSINGMMVDGALQFSFDFSNHNHNLQPNALELPTLFVQQLRELIDECGDGKRGALGAVTPSDFPLVVPNLTQSMLDDVIMKSVGVVGQSQCVAPSNIEDIYPTTPMQEGMIFHTVEDAHSQVYITQLCWKILLSLSNDSDSNDNDNDNDNDSISPPNPLTGESEPESEKPKPRKRTLSAEQRERFALFWNAYPNQVGIGAAEKEWAKLSPSAELTEEIVAAVRTAKEKDHRFSEARYTPRPANWLKNREWKNKYPNKTRNSNSNVKFSQRSYTQEELSKMGKRIGVVPDDERSDDND